MTERSGPAATPVAIAVVQRGDQFLVGVRPDGPLSGYCEFPGGKVRDGETPATAAARECLEETGLEVSVGRLLVRTVHEYEHGRLDLHQRQFLWPVQLGWREHRPHPHQRARAQHLVRRRLGARRNPGFSATTAEALTQALIVISTEDNKVNEDSLTKSICLRSLRFLFV